MKRRRSVRPGSQECRVQRDFFLCAVHLGPNGFVCIVSRRRRSRARGTCSPPPAARAARPPRAARRAPRPKPGSWRPRTAARATCGIGSRSFKASNVTREYPSSLLMLQGNALLPFSCYKGIPFFPSNVTREYPSSLLMLQGNTLLPF